MKKSRGGSHALAEVCAWEVFLDLHVGACVLWDHLVLVGFVDTSP